MRTRTVVSTASLSLALTLSPLESRSASGDVDLSFDPSSSVNGMVNTVAIQSNGKILFGGSFTTVHGAMRSCLARFNADGSLDNSFQVILTNSTGATSVRRLLLESDGKILIAGSFTSVNGVGWTNLARLHADGSLDPSSFSGLPEPDAYLYAICEQADGKILLGGYSTSVNGVQRSYLARLNHDGTLDNSFLNGLTGPNNYYVFLIGFQSDGRILVHGDFTSFSGIARTNLARLNPDGSLDSTFLTPNADYAWGVTSWALQNDGKILIAGPFACLGRTNLARLNGDGSLDESFPGNLKWGVNHPEGPNPVIALQPDGKILIGGSFTSVNGVARTNFARLSSDGTVDESFLARLPDMKTALAGVCAFALQPDGKIVVAGGDFMIQTPISYVVRLLGDSAPPEIVTQPSTQTAEIGATAYIGVEATGTGMLTYQWFFNDTQALGAPTTNCVLELSSVQSLNVGSYTVVVSDGGHSVTSAPAYLNVITPVERRIVPAVKLLGAPGSLLHLESLDSLKPPHNWQSLTDVTLIGASEYYFDLTTPMPQQRFMRARQAAPVTVVPECRISMVPALTLTGHVGDVLRIDCINCFGPTNAWVSLDTVTLTNTSQLYFDVAAPYQPSHLYRLVQVP